MRRIIVIAVLVLSGCRAEKSADHEAIVELQRRVDALQKEQSEDFDLLSQANANIHKRIDATQLDFQESRKPIAAANAADEGAWIAWENRTVSENPNRIMYKSIAPLPRASYATQSSCYAAIDRVSKATGGSKGVWSETHPETQTTFLINLSCLPKSVDPR